MSDEINRRETTYVDARTGDAKCTAQWLLENKNLKGKVTHPITHNNKLTMFICGKDGFADIAKEIRNARESIDLCCWGFDPGMELERKPDSNWPRGETYGDMLIAAGRRGVKVRLLVYYDSVAKQAGQLTNLPGFTHDTSVWRRDGGREPEARKLSATNSLAALREALSKSPLSQDLVLTTYLLCHGTAFTEEHIPLLARQEYCYSWYRAAFARLLKNVEIRTHTGDTDSIRRAIAGEWMQPHGAERQLVVRFGTHHQKPILIDFNHENGSKAVGYVMGLNSVTDYWDSTAHDLEDSCRERFTPAQAAKASEFEQGFKTFKPFRDYACRIDRGGAVIGLYNNFISSWNRAGSEKQPDGLPVKLNSEPGGHPVPAALLCAAEPGDSTVQIIRTQATEQDQTIRDIYFKAADNASLAFRYLYVENQYFQYEEWTKRLLDKRRKVMELWNKARQEANLPLSEMPILHVFVVIPVPEREQMIPRTYDALARLGQQGTMTGQQKLIDKETDRVKAENFMPWYERSGALPDVVRYANEIEKPDPKTLESRFGLKVCTAMLNACGTDGKTWRYREIYIHSKLLLVDDVFCTLGSANLNQRSMVGDSELNLATIDVRVAGGLRRKIWNQLSGGEISGGNGRKDEIAHAFDEWTVLMKENRASQLDHGPLTGQLLPLDDKRSSTTRYG